MEGVAGRGGKGGVDADEARCRALRRAEVPFDPSLKLMATFHAAEPDQWGSSSVCARQGAADVLSTARWSTPTRGGRSRPPWSRWRAGACGCSMVAERTIPARRPREVGDPVDLLTDLDVVGLIGLLDPPRPEARAAIALCRKAGVTVKMITGDHVVTAGAIAADLGIQGEAVTGADLDAMDDEEPARRRPERYRRRGPGVPGAKVRIVRPCATRATSWL